MPGFVWSEIANDLRAVRDRIRICESVVSRRLSVEGRTSKLRDLKHKLEDHGRTLSILESRLTPDRDYSYSPGDACHLVQLRVMMENFDPYAQ